MIIFTAPKHVSFTGDWSRKCSVDGVEYHVSVRRGRRVRIPYKPRGRNIGWKWIGAVYRDGKCLWSDHVPGSIGAKGLLTYAGVITKPERD